MRPSWDQYFMELAFAASTRATCPRRSVGAILVKDKTVIGTGYNGAEPGEPHCTDIGCLLDIGGTRCLRTTHAERNAIRRSLRDPSMGYLYCTDMPCLDCARDIVLARISRVIYLRPYERTQEQVLKLFKDNAILVKSMGYIPG